MKKLLFYILFFPCLSGFSQLKNNTITVRKLPAALPVEIIRFSPLFTKTDSAINYEYENVPITFHGIGGGSYNFYQNPWSKNRENHWFFDKNTVYLFHSPLKKRMRKLAYKKKEKFWRIIQRKEIKYDTEPIKSTVSSYGSNSIISTFQYRYVLDSATLDTLQTSTLQIGQNSFASNENISTLKLEIGENEFYIDNETMRISSRRKWQDPQLNFIVSQCREQKKSSSVTGSFKCHRKIEKNNLSLHLSSDGNIVNDLIFYRNNDEQIICEFEVQNNIISIQNPPYYFLQKGKFNKKKNQIKFKDSTTRKTYTFKLKHDVLTQSRYNLFIL